MSYMNVGSKRTISHLRGDTKRKLKLKSDGYLRVYIGRIAIRMLAADALLRDRGGPANTALSPSAAKVLELVQDLSQADVEDDD